MNKAMLIVAAVFSFNVLAETAAYDRILKYDVDMLCTYKDQVYSIGSVILIGNNVLRCLESGKNEDGSESNIKIAHWTWIQR